MNMARKRVARMGDGGYSDEYMSRNGLTGDEYRSAPAPALTPEQVRANIDARDAYHEAGNIDVTRAGVDGRPQTSTFTNNTYASDPQNRADMAQVLNEGMLYNPDRIWGDTKGRQVSADEKKYREAYNVVHNPGASLSNLSPTEAVKYLAMFASIAFGGGALAQLGAAGAAGAGAGASAGASAGAGSGAVAPGAVGAAADAGIGGALEAALPEIVVSGSAGLSPLVTGALGAGLGAGAASLSGSATAGNAGLGSGLDTPLDEIVVSGAPAGLSPGALGAVGAGAGAASGALGSSGASNPASAADEDLPEVVVEGTPASPLEGALPIIAGGALGAGAAAAGAGSPTPDPASEGKGGPEKKPGFGGQLLDYIKNHPIGALQTLGGLLGGSNGSGSSGGPPRGTIQGTDVLPPAAFNRTQTPYQGDYNMYGMGPEHKFFTDSQGGALARGGRPRRHGALGLPSTRRPGHFVNRGTGAPGRADNIDAKLSENEYVIDAETVALLGDGNPEAGAQKLDTMRSNIRAHKGKALSRGAISPNAKAGALQYLAEGGKVGAIRAFFQKKDPNANLRRINAALEQALSRPPVASKRAPTAEELAQDVERLRREVGAQGGDTRPLRRARGGALRYAKGGRTNGL